MWFKQVKFLICAQLIKNLTYLNYKFKREHTWDLIYTAV